MAASNVDKIAMSVCSMSFRSLSAICDFDNTLHGQQCLEFERIRIDAASNVAMKLDKFIEKWTVYAERSIGVIAFDGEGQRNRSAAQPINRQFLCR